MSPLTMMALCRVPALGRFLAAPQNDDAETQIALAVERAAGTTSASAAETACPAGTEAGARLQLALETLAADLAATAYQAELTRTDLAIRAGAALALQQAGYPASATPPSRAVTAVSIAILLSFVAVVAIVLLHGLPVGSETAANVLLGTLAAMATSVVSYWVGSSAGSARKDERMLAAVKAP